MKFLFLFAFVFPKRSVASDHLAIVLVGTEDHEAKGKGKARRPKNRAKVVKVVKVAKQLEMMEVHETEIQQEDVDVSLSEISVNVKVEMRMLAMAIKRMVRIVSMVTFAVQESHASAHAIDLIRIAAAIR